MRARALSRATLACRGWGHWSSNARCDHRDRRSFSSSSSLKILCPLGLKDLVSFVFARRVRYSSISLSLSFIRSRERSLIPKGHSTKTTKITLKGIIETTFPRKIETVPTDLSSRFRAPSRQKRAVFSLLRKATILDDRICPNPNRIERAFNASVKVRAPKTVVKTTRLLFSVSIKPTKTSSLTTTT